jgi:hypothetical protein
MFENRYKTIEFMLAVWSAYCSLSMIDLLDIMRCPSLSSYERWLVFRRFCMVATAALVYIAVRIHRFVPWWAAVLNWLCAMNTNALAATLVVYVDLHATELFPEQAGIRLRTNQRAGLQV